ncbi:MAG: hypothetical protein SFY32_11625, partial [Bacteroidota bacterium]|nr:hypothetical protein [Bacteroidota bacterium]
LGIDSVISIGDDELLEKLRKYYCIHSNREYNPILNTDDDFRAKRITLYLNLINELAEEKFYKFKEELAVNCTSRNNYFRLLPESSQLLSNYHTFLTSNPSEKETKHWINQHLRQGSIDVNIMTKADRENYRKSEKLPVIFNDAHAGLRGYCQSKLVSSIVFSAGMNPRLFTYAEEFNDFYPDNNGCIQKKIILKVTDFRSARIQGMFLAKKGLWVSEFRIESGLNCGGHAFASDGTLMGPILEEFKNKRNDLSEELQQLFVQALIGKNKTIPKLNPGLKITAQGGVGTAEEHQFLLNYYNLDSIGWGTPFLLVPEAINIDPTTLQKLIAATEHDLYLSDVSPLGVPFNTLRGNSMEEEKYKRVKSNKPGSPCIKKHLITNTEFTKLPICIASRKYQHEKIKELDQMMLSADEYQHRLENITEKECLCTGLGQTVLINNNIPSAIARYAVSICPGPNMAYFTKAMSLQEIIDHIYGRINVITRTDRPNVFIKELDLNINFLKGKINKQQPSQGGKEQKEIQTFLLNLEKGIKYYFELFTGTSMFFSIINSQIIEQLKDLEKETMSIRDRIQQPSLPVY